VCQSFYGLDGGLNLPSCSRRPTRKLFRVCGEMVGTTGFEPATSSVSRKRSNQLSYAPVR
jgi:hypothetical protein